MIQILGYMVAAYGISRLLQVTAGDENRDFGRVIGILGVAALAVLAVMLTQQANSLSSLGLG